MSITPRSKPQITRDRVMEILHNAGVSDKVPVIVGMRGYYLDTMGKPGVNDRGIYDDAIITISPDYFATFNANTDPSRVRKGYGTAEGTKGMAVLKTGVWLYKKGAHKGQYAAFIQADKVTVVRDGNPPYEDTGWFGINIHKGGYNTTSSEGCQTVHPDQYRDFQRNAYIQMDKFRVSTIQYVLIEQQG